MNKLYALVAVLALVISFLCFQEVYSAEMPDSVKPASDRSHARGGDAGLHPDVFAEFGFPSPPGYPADLAPAFANVAYSSLSAAQTLDVFLPQGEGPFPLVVNIHGGAFKFGSKVMLDAPLARRLLAEGIAIASINYRLSGEAVFPAAVEDAKCAVRFLRAKAARYRLDPERIVVFGQSAGGNIASLVGVTGGTPVFENDALGCKGVSSRVRGVIDWFGPADFAGMDDQAREQGCPAAAQTHGQGDSPESLYLGAPLALVPDKVRMANPVTYISSRTPPFLLEKGTRDCVVPVGQTTQLYEALKAAGVPVELVMIKDAGHGDTGSDPRFLAPENIDKVLEFVKKVTAKQGAGDPTQ